MWADWDEFVEDAKRRVPEVSRVEETELKPKIPLSLIASSIPCRAMQCLLVLCLTQYTTPSLKIASCPSTTMCTGQAAFMNPSITLIASEDPLYIILIVQQLLVLENFSSVSIYTRFLG